MNTTHYLELHHSEHECDNIECLCNRSSGLCIIMNVLRSRPMEKYFIQFYSLHNSTPEYLAGLGTDERGCRFYDPRPPQTHEV